MPSIPPAIYATPSTHPPNTTTTTTGGTSAHQPQLHFLNHHRQHQPQQQLQAPAPGHHHHHSFHRIDHDHPHGVSQHVKPFSPAAPVAPVMPGAHHFVASLSQSGINARASASLGAAASPAHPSSGHKAQHHPPSSGSFVFNASSHHHGGNTGNPRHLHHSISYTTATLAGANSSSSASMSASSSSELLRLQSPYRHNPYSWADGAVTAAAARAQGEGRRTDLSPGDLSRTARPGTPPPATAAGVLPLPPALPNFAYAPAAVSAPDDVAALAAPAVAVGAPFNTVGAPGASAGPNSSRGATTVAASAAGATTLIRSVAPPTLPPRYSMSVSVGGQAARGECEQQQQQRGDPLHHYPVNDRRPPQQQQQHQRYLGRPELGVESLASASSVVAGLLGDLDGAVCLSPLVTLTAATVGVEAMPPRGLPPAPPALPPPVPPPALTHAASRLSGSSAASISTALMMENQQPAVAPAVGTVAKGVNVTAEAVAAAAASNTKQQQEEGEEGVYVLDNVKPQHRLAMPYVPLSAVLAATLRSQRRARGEPCGDGVVSWGADELAKELNEDAPGGARTRMASVFVAQLPFDMPLEALQSLADEVVPGGPVRIVLAAPHLRNRRSYDGCAFLRMPEADAHRFVAALHKRVLFDVDGAWYAETAEHTEAIAAYCDWIQNKTKTLRRRLLPRPTPYSPMTAEFAIKSGSRISRSRTVRMSSSEDAEDAAEMP